LHTVATANFDPTNVSDFTGVGLFLQSPIGIAGDGNFGSALAWSRPEDNGRFKTAIAPVQEGSDVDRQGLAFFTADDASALVAPEERLRISNTGNVGIGRTSPGEKLDILSTSGNCLIKMQAPVGSVSGFNAIGSNVLAFQTGFIEKARIDTSGRLLVGTSSGDGSVNKFQVKGNTSGDTGGNISLSRGAIPTAVNQTIGLISFGDGGGDVYAEIKSQADGTAAAGDAPGRLVFSTTAAGASTPTERLRIDSNGDVKIGGTLPASPNISLNANGSAVFKSGVFGRTLSSTNSSTNVDASAFEVYQADYGSQNSTNLKAKWANTGDIYIGGGLTGAGRAPNISLNANGTATFGVNTGTYQTGANISHDASDNTTLTVYSKGSSTVNSFAVYDNSESGPNKYRATIKQDGSATFAGDVSATGGNVKLKNEGSGGKIQIIQLNTATEAFQLGTVATPSAVALKADGSATFAGGDCEIRNNGSLNITVDDATSQASLASLRGSISGTVQGTMVYKNAGNLELRQGTTAVKINLNGTDGSASFAGNVAIGDETGINVQLNVEETTGTKPVSRFHADNAVSDLIQGVKQSTAVFRVANNGNVTNTNNSYGAISDIKLKENIVDANSQWDDLKALQVRHYNFKPETGYSNHTQIGLVAQ
jgi:hypothetical protein